MMEGTMGEMIVRNDHEYDHKDDGEDVKMS
jgi:hypothetical protein